MTDRILLGALSPGFGLRASLPGYDVTASLTEDQLAFDSTWADMLQVHAAGTGTCSSTSSISYQGDFYRLATFTSLGFVPSAMVWSLTNNDSVWQVPLSLLVTYTGLWLGYNLYAGGGSGVPSGSFGWAVSKVPMLG